MQVNQTTDKLYFVSEKIDTVDVKITNQYTKKVTFEKTLSVTEEGYYNVITDNAFNFQKNQMYILDIFRNQNLIYRCTIYSDVDKIYPNANKINTQDEYITI